MTSPKFLDHCVKVRLDEKKNSNSLWFIIGKTMKYKVNWTKIKGLLCRFSSVHSIHLGPHNFKKKVKELSSKKKCNFFSWQTLLLHTTSKSASCYSKSTYLFAVRVSKPISPSVFEKNRYCSVIVVYSMIAIISLAILIFNLKPWCHVCRVLLNITVIFF